LGEDVTRILVEPVEVPAGDAVELIEDIHRALDELGLTAPRLQHGDGEATWVLLTDAVQRGLDTRIGLEDTLCEPNGQRTAGNEALVRAARELGAGRILPAERKRAGAHLAKVARALSEPLRLELLSRLLFESATVTELVAATGSTQPNVSNHLSVLRHEGLVRGERPGGRSVTSSPVPPSLSSSRPSWR
jgi:hypothetical protein